MPTKCCVCKKCMKDPQDKGNHVRTFHRFPIKNSKLFNNWMENITNSGKKLSLASSNMRICSDHFPRTCFIDSSRGLKLIHGSIPTIFRKPIVKCIYCGSFTRPVIGRTFHRFPLSNTSLCDEWVAVVENHVASTVDRTKSILCSEHFEKEMFYKHGKDKKYRRLRTYAVPTIFQECSISSSRQKSMKGKNETSGMDAESATKEPDITMGVACKADLQNNDDTLNSIEEENQAFCRQIAEDHNYFFSLGTITKKYDDLKDRYMALNEKFRQQKRQITRLQIKNVTLTCIIKDLHKKSGVRTTGLHLESKGDEEIIKK